MVGGIVIEVINAPNKIWVNVKERRSSQTCAVYVEINSNSRKIKEGDFLWWQGGEAMWTPKGADGKCGVDYDIQIPRIGYSGVPKPE
jgi:hypothetical protein